MKEAQGPSEKEAKKIYEIEKVMALTVFKKYYPDASIVFNEPGPIEEVVIEEEPTKEELNAIALEAARVKAEALFDKKLADEKAAKKAELEAQLKALDES